MILDYTKKITKKVKKKNYFGSELSDYIRLYQKVTKNREKNKKLLLGQNYLKRIMSQLLDF